jgi:SlyX protein
MEDRVTELELRFTEQEHLLQELSAALFSQQKELDALRARVAYLEKKLQAEPGLVDPSTDKDPPPHY